MRVGLVYTDTNKNTRNISIDPHGTKQMNKTVEAIKLALENKNYEVIMIPADIDMLTRIKNANVDVIFNACTGIRTKKEQANVVGMLELLDIPFVGSSLSSHIFGLHKEISKVLFRKMGIPTPNSQLFYNADMKLDGNLRFPLIVKPEHEGSSLGIDEKSVVYNEKTLYEKVREVINTFNQPALVEEYVGGREFTIGIIGDKELKVFEILEVIYSKMETNFMTVSIKAKDAAGFECPANIDEELELKLKDYAKKAFRALELRDYARVDVRLDKFNNPFFIEINTLPGLEPGYSDFPKMAEKSGISYDDLIEELTLLAYNRR
jgi:D-alanine-D-alanine ligase